MYTVILKIMSAARFMWPVRPIPIMKEGRNCLTSLRSFISPSFYQISVDQLLFGDFSGIHSTEDVIREHTAITQDDSLIRLNGADAKMLMDYKSFPSREQKEVREFVRFKKYLFTRENLS